MKILITGASGLVGSRLCARLKRAGHEVVALSRDGERAAAKLGVTAFSWDYRTEPVPRAATDGADSIVHLMGENVGDGRWTAARKKAIADSRIVSAKKLIAARPASLASFVSASAIGYYPGSGDEIYDETYRMPQQVGFMQALCRDWELAAAAVEEHGVRRVSVRIGLVLGKGGLLQKLLPLFRAGLGGPVGDGRQWLPWIHIDDLVTILERSISDESMHGAVNGVGPDPVTYATFARSLGAAVKRPALLRVPATALKLMLGEAAELALGSYRIVPRRLTEEFGFSFGYADIEAALESAIALNS